MPKHSSLAGVAAAGTSAAKSPSEPQNRWKIPHYYKRTATESTSASTPPHTLTPTSAQPPTFPGTAATPRSTASTPDLSRKAGRFIKSPSLKNLTSPKKLIMDDHHRKQSRAKKNAKPGMVFVNYTVQDDVDKMNADAAAVSDSSALPVTTDVPHDLSQELSHEIMQQQLMPCIPQAKPTSKQKSARKRMLKIFGASKNKFPGMHSPSGSKLSAMDPPSAQPPVPHHHHSHSQAVTKPTPLNRSISTPSLVGKEEMVMPSGSGSSSGNTRGSVSSSQGKRSSGVFMKHAASGKLRSTSSSIASSGMLMQQLDTEVSFDDMMAEMVPKSDNTQLQKTNGSTYSNLTSTYMNDPQLNAVTASLPMYSASSANISGNSGRGASETAGSEQAKLLEFNFKNPLSLNSATSLNSSSETRHNTTFSASATHLPQYAAHNGQNVSPISNNTFGISPSSESPNVRQVNSHPTGHEDNDASIAFSKMFTQKKRASTMDSIAPSRSSRNSLTNGVLQAKPTGTGNSDGSLNNNPISTAMANMYSPIRTVSPARTRSSTRGSANFRLSKDFTALGSVPDSTETGYVNNSAYMDSQNTHKIPMMNPGNVNGINLTNNRSTHRKKQESISEAFNKQQQMMNNTIQTPSTGMPLVTPPYFATAFGVPSSNSTSSTPSVGDLSAVGYTSQNNAHQTGSMYLDGNAQMDNNQSNSVIELSDIQTPMESTTQTMMPMSAQSVPTQGTPSNNIIRQTKDHKTSRPMHDQESAQYLPNDVSTSGSSAMESLMTNSLSASTSITFNGMPTSAPNVVYQNDNGTPYTLVNTGTAMKEVDLNHFSNNGPQSQNSLPEQNVNVQDNVNNNNSQFNEDQLINQMYMEFEFENPAASSVEQPRMSNNGTATNMGFTNQSPAMTAIAEPASSSSPSTIVPGSNVFMQHGDHGNSTTSTNITYNNSMVNASQMGNSTLHSASTMPGDVTNVGSAMNMNFGEGSMNDFNNNDIATAFFLDN